MTILQITCLHDFQLTVDGSAPTAFLTDKARALLVYLALEPQVHSRDQLAELFWSGYSKESARNSLRQALHLLRQFLPTTEIPWLLLTRQTVQINAAAPIAVDVATFTRLLATVATHSHVEPATCTTCLAHLRQAVGLYHSDFLTGLSVIDSTPFEEWRSIRQEQLHIQMLGALTHLAASAEAAGDDRQALHTARRLLTLEPWLETAHRQVMRMLARLGQHTEALAHYQHCRQVLAETLHTAPEAETTALYEQIRQGHDDSPTFPHSSPTHPPAARQIEQSKSGIGTGNQAYSDPRPAESPITQSPNPPIPLPHNLPSFPTPLVGRAEALTQIAAYLQQPELRLLTLVGPGGMGKTRLAIEVGHEQQLAFADGICFVALAAVSTPSALAGTIATTLGIVFQGDEPRRALLSSLRAKQLLLILDNFEHLLVADDGGSLDALDLVVDLLEAAPRVQILVTSRQRLNLRSEQIYSVPALHVAANATLDEATASAAVCLFVQVVQSVQAGFQLTTENLAAVLRICQAVQGMPLGLELAAANVHGAPLTAIADALEQSAEILTVNWRDLPTRQRSMRAVFAWSWHLLTPDEQRALRRISIFRGGFDYTAAQAVTDATLPLLTGLLHKSLLQELETATGTERYLMHELLRQFAAEELHTAGEWIPLEARHGRYYLAYLAARGFHLGRNAPKAASAEIEGELENIRLAWQWAATQGAWQELESALYAWWQFCRFQGREAEGEQRYATAIAAVRTQDVSVAAAHPAPSAADGATVLLRQRLLANLLAIHANFLYLHGRNAEMTAQAREAIDLGLASGDVAAETFGTFVLGRAALERGEVAEAEALWQQTLSLVHRYQPLHPENELLHDAYWMALNALRGNAIRVGDYAGSRAYLMQALQVCQALGKQQGELITLSRLAQSNFLLYDFAAAAAGWKSALDLARQLGYRRVEMLAQEGLGGIARLHGAYATARRQLEQALTIATELAAPYEEAAIAATLIRLYAQLGDQVAAAQRHEQLRRLLARVTLIQESQLYASLAAALKAHYAGEEEEALYHAEAANQRIKNGDILFRVVDTALIVGHARAAAGQWAAAAAAFQQAHTALQQFGTAALAAEPQAGLAQIALAQGDTTGAMALVEPILPLLAEQPHPGYNTPFFIYLTCYRVLAANGDPRAPHVLQQGYTVLQQAAAGLDEESRRHFLTGVTIHRALVAAYAERQAQESREAEGRSPEGRNAEISRLTDKENHAYSVPLSSAPLPSVPLPSAPLPSVPLPSVPLPSAPLPSVPLSSVPLSSVYDWAEMPAVDFFVERRVEVAQLTSWLVPTAVEVAPARLISILGMGGIGKTTLAAMVTKAVAPNFAVVIWRSLLNAPPLSELLRNWLQVLSRQTLTALPESLDEQLRRLLAYLQQERCLLVLDNVESIFAADKPAAEASPHLQSRAGVTRPGYEGYDQLLQRLASSDHQSCLLLTSREQPYALARAGRQAQMSGRVQVLPLAGLDQQAGQVLLMSNGLHTSAVEAAQLIESYSGNPLALQIVAATIADFFGGDVGAFQQEEGQIFDGMRLVLDQQFARLSGLEQEILVWLAIEREPVTVPMLRSNFVDLHPEARTAALLEALQALQNRSLLEKRDSGLTLQNVIIEYMTEYLVEQIYREICELQFTNYDLREAVPDAEFGNRQSKIVNSFLNRFALLKAQAKEEVRQSQVRLILQPLAGRLLAQLGQAQLETRVMALVQGLQAAAPGTSGYAGGNLLNLLLHLGSDLRGRNFAKLALWQVFLAGAYVPGLNLSGADLTGTVFTQRFGTLRNIQFDDQGDLLLVDIHNRWLRLLRLRDGQLYHEIALPDWHFGELFLSPDCKSVLLSLADHRVALLDLTTGKLSPPQARHQHPIWRFCFSPDGRFVATGDSGGLICLWNRHGQLVQTRQVSANAVSAVAIAPDGTTMASANVAGTIFLWSLADQSALRRFQGHEDEVATLVFLDNGRLLASGSHDLTVGLWDVATGELRQRLRGHTRPVRKIVAAIMGQWLVTGGGDHFLYVWDWQRGAPQHLLADHTSPIDQLVISADGKQAATQDLNTVVSLWDLTQGRRIDYYAIYYNAIMSICFSRDGQTLVSGGSDGAVYLWEMDNSVGLRLTDRLTAHKHRIFGVALHPDGNLIASAGDNAGIALWDRSSGRLVQTLQGHAKNIAMLDFSPNGNWLASGNGDGTVTLWSMPEARQQRQLQVHTNIVSCCAFSPSRVDALGQPRQRIASGSFDHSLAIWNAESGELLHHLHGHTNAIGRCLFSHDGERLISVSYDETLCIWDVESGERLATWQQLGGGYVALAVHPAGQLLAVSCIDYAIRLLELSSGRCLAELRGHSLLVISLAFHPTKPLLASAGSDETIRLWDISSAALETGPIGCLHTLQAPTPYAGMKITDVTGISVAQKAALKALGAVEE